MPRMLYKTMCKKLTEVARENGVAVTEVPGFEDQSIHGAFLRGASGPLIIVSNECSAMQKVFVLADLIGYSALPSGFGIDLTEESDGMIKEIFISGLNYHVPPVVRSIANMILKDLPVMVRSYQIPRILSTTKPSSSTSVPIIANAV